MPAPITPDALTRLDLPLASETPAPTCTQHESQQQVSATITPDLRVVLVVHRIGTEGPWWADCCEIEADGTLGWIIHSGAFQPTREGAVEAARQGLARRGTERVRQ